MSIGLRPACVTPWAHRCTTDCICISRDSCVSGVSRSFRLHLQGAPPPQMGSEALNPLSVLNSYTWGSPRASPARDLFTVIRGRTYVHHKGDFRGEGVRRASAAIGSVATLRSQGACFGLGCCRWYAAIDAHAAVKALQHSFGLGSPPFVLPAPQASCLNPKRETSWTWARLQMPRGMCLSCLVKLPILATTDRWER